MSGEFEKFQDNVLSKGVHAVIPSNLSDYWLKYLLEQDYKFNNNLEKPDLCAILSAVQLIIYAKKGQTLEDLSDDKLEELFDQYCTELELEAVHRHTEFIVKPATLETIFTDREVEIRKKLFS